MRDLGDRKTHAANSGFVHQIHDQFEFVEAFEVRHLGLITGFNECLVSSEHKCAQTTAENSLFTEEVGFGLFLKGCFNDTSASSTDAFGPG